MDGLVEADVLDGRADDGATGVLAAGAGDDVYIRCADDDVEWKRWWKLDGKHLSLSWSDSEGWSWWKHGGPCAGAVDELGGAESGGGSVDLDMIGMRAHHEDGGANAEVDGGRLDGGQERGGEFVRVEAVLFQVDEVMGAGLELGEKSRE